MGRKLNMTGIKC